ncbi:hypothetical protein M1D88_18255 [Arthrobacter sp. R1-13]
MEHKGHHRWRDRWDVDASSGLVDLNSHLAILDEHSAKQENPVIQENPIDAIKPTRRGADTN